MSGRVVPCLRILAIIAGALGLSAAPRHAWAAPFDEQIQFAQPDGSVLRLHGWGDEFQATFETLDGYTVLFDEAKLAYCFARVAPDGTLRSTGLPAHLSNPASIGLEKHIRMSPYARKRLAQERRQLWELGTGNQRRWEEHKAALRQYEQLASRPGGIGTNVSEMSPPTATTTGVKVGLTLLIDFPDDPATIPQAEIVNFCNAEGYNGYGNNGSVRNYFYDNSKGILTYSNVVTIYIRVPQPKSYYNITTNDCGAQGNILIKAALDTMKALPNYTTEILPAFASLTTDASSRVAAFNVFYAGGNGGVWSKGLWPHSWSLYNAGQQALGNGKYVYRYQLTNIGTSLALGTFCHENGHMLCGFPDIYDYDYDSTGGAGVFCLMNSGGSGTNPRQVCAYLKRAAGWATTVELNSASQLMGSVSAPATAAEFNKFYRYQKPGVATEYYLLENRQKAGRDSGLPCSGLAVWHVDELGNRDDQSTNFNTTHANYEASLVQADNQYHFQKDINSGDAYDLYYLGNTSAGYTNSFTDLTGPSARWWDGSASGLIIDDISAAGATVTFRVGSGPPPLTLVATVIADHNGTGTVDYNETNECYFVFRNDGVQNAVNVSASISSAVPGVTIVQSSAAYPDVAPGRLATNLTPCVFYTSPDFVCGTPVTMTVLASCLGRSTTNNAVFASGDALAVRADVADALPIPDQQTVYSTNFVSGFEGQLADLNVSLYLTHTYDRDLVIDLISPDGTTATLVNGAGGNGDNFGSSCADSSRTVFSDSASQAIGAGSAPFVGSFRPEQPLAIFAGEAAAVVNGPWVLRVQDKAKTDTGVVQCWSLFAKPHANCIDGSLAPPLVVLDSPTNRAVFPSGTPVIVSASVSDLDSAIARVDFYADGTMLGSVFEPPYSCVWSNPPLGAHLLSARAEDTTGLAATASARIGIRGDAPPLRWTGGGEDATWGDAFNWNLFRAPLNSEALVFAGTNRLAATNNVLSSAGAITFAGSGFTIGGGPLTLTSGITNFGQNTWALNSRLGAAQSFVSSNGLLTLAGNLTNYGYALTLNGGGDLALSGLLTGVGALVKQGAGTATLSGNQPYTGGTTVNGGTLVLLTGGIAGTLRGVLSVNSAGTLRSDAADALGYGSTRVTLLNLNGGALNHASGNNLSIWGATVNLTGGTLQATASGSGSIDLGTDSNAGGVLTIVNSMASSNSSTLGGNRVRLRQANVDFNVADGSAPVDLLVSAAVVSGTTGSGFTKRGLGTMVLTGSNFCSGNIYAYGGTLLVNGSLGTNSLYVYSPATIGGSGLLRGRLTVYSGGTLSPGPGLAMLTVSNAITLQGTTRMEIAKTGSQLRSDLLRGATTLAYGGTLIVTNTGPDSPVEGDSFQLFSASSYSGSFGVTGLPILGVGLGWDTTGLRSNGVIRVAVLPSVTADPQDLVLTNGGYGALSVSANGTAPLLYQWRKDGQNVPAAAAASLSLGPVAEVDAGMYDAIISNPAGSVTSAVALVTVLLPPTIIAEPQDASVALGADTAFSITATGTPPLYYQWQHGETAIPEGTNSTLGFSAVTEQDAGLYQVVVSNAAGQVMSRTATLTVELPSPVLSAGISNGVLNLSWPENYRGYALQQQLGCLTNEWLDISNGTNHFWSAPVLTETNSVFFRLIKRL